MEIMISVVSIQLEQSRGTRQVSVFLFGLSYGGKGTIYIVALSAAIFSSFSAQ